MDNWGGGYIVIGVEEEDGRPVYPLKGVPAEKLEQYQKQIFAKCKLIRPAYMPIIGKETYQDKHFIVIWCPGGESRPYSSPKTIHQAEMSDLNITLIQNVVEKNGKHFILAY